MSWDRDTHLKFSGADLERVTTESGRYYLNGKVRLPSVTTVLKYFKGPTPQLDAWRERVGAEEADRIRDRSSSIGDMVHQIVSDSVRAMRVSASGTGEHAETVNEHVQRIWPVLHKRVKAFHATEAMVVHPLGMAGTVDLVCEWETDDGPKLSVVDFKTKGPKGLHPIARDEHFIQAAIYAQAWKDMYGHTPNHLVLLESAEGADSAKVHEDKLWPYRAKTVGDAPFVKALLRAQGECKEW